MVYDIDQNSFEKEVINSELPVVVDFWAEWCGPCKNLAPILKDIASKRSDVKIVKINVDDNPDLAVQFRIQSIPTMVFIKGGKAINIKVGFSSASEIDSWIESNL